MSTAAALTQRQVEARWHGHLDLSLERRERNSCLSRRRHQGPMLVQRPFYPEGPDHCHVYLLHPPGGMVGGDRLSCRVDVGCGARGLITTPSAGKAYRVEDGQLSQTQHSELHLREESVLEWLPQPFIAFSGARSVLSTRIDFQPDATVIGWDILCLGRPASGERFDRGVVQQQLELWCDGRPRFVEKARFTGGDPLLEARWGLQGQTVSGTLYAYWPAPQRAEIVSQLRQGIDQIPDHGAGEHPARLAVTLVNHILLVRYLGSCAEQCQHLFGEAWKILRPLLLGRAACAPRIWNT